MRTRRMRRCIHAASEGVRVRVRVRVCVRVRVRVHASCDDQCVRVYACILQVGVEILEILASF